MRQLILIHIYLCMLLGLSTLILGQQDHHSVGVDASGCQRCEEQFNNWLTNRTKPAYWTSLDSSKDVADQLCKWTSDIYYKCYDVCGIDTNNNTVSFTDDSRAKSMKTWLEENCVTGECRLADAMICRYNPIKPKCDASVLECYSEHRETEGCQMEKMCSVSEKRAFINHIESGVDCFLGYDQNKQTDKEYTVTEEMGLQQCKDMLLTHCLKSWSETSYGWENIINFSVDERHKICSKKTYVDVCINNAVEGILYYRGNRYEAPCNPELMRYPEHVALFKQQIADVHTRLCAEDADPCSDPYGEAEASTPEPTEPPKDTEASDKTPSSASDDKEEEGDHSGVHITDTKKSSADENNSDNAATTLHVTATLAIIISAAYILL